MRWTSRTNARTTPDASTAATRTQETSEKHVQDPSNRLSTERLGDLYDRHAFGVAREETVDYEKLAANYGMKAELVERILKHTRKPNVVEKYVDGQPRLVAERDGT
eukprot:scaffold977_cov286-Pavlova_lutheri.AAC.4